MNLSTTQELREDLLAIRQELRNGTLSNAVARTLLQGAKFALDTLRLEMDVARLGCDFGSVNLRQEDRNGKIRKAA